MPAPSYRPRIARRARVLVACLGLGAMPMVSACNCSKTAPEPETKASGSVGARPIPTPAWSAGASLMTIGPDGAVTQRLLPHDRLGNPVSSAIADGSAPPEAQLPREPDWDLDLEDGARDYVIRYIRATRRYDDKTACVAVEKSTDAGSKKRVVVRDDPKSSCGGTSTEERDVFLVDPAGDRLGLEDTKKQAALKKWPDGSDPEAPASSVGSVDDLKKWRTPLYEALVQLKLVPVRVQFYGRGSYTVITLAGWHEGSLARLEPADKLGALAEKLCAASDKNPLGIFGGMNRVDFLRVRCPGVGPATTKPTVKWEKM